MKLSGLRALGAGLLGRGDTEPPPGTVGPARVGRATAALLRRVGPGDIVVLDEIDLDRRTADALVAAEVAGVVNASPSVSGRYPNLGPEILVAAGITLVDGVGADVLGRVRDGSKLRLHDGLVHLSDEQIASGVQQTQASIADQMIQAKEGMAAQLEAFSANTIEFLKRERTLVLDGLGVPEVPVPMAGREVVVVACGYDQAHDLRVLRRYLRDHRPVLIGVEAGADVLLEAGLRPDLIVGDPRGIETDTLKCGAPVVVPADADGHAPGLARVQDLGVGAITFAASANPEDLALLIADAHEATVVITVGFQATLHEFLDRGRSGSNPATFLTRLRLGGKVVDGQAVAALYRGRVPVPAVLALLLSALLALVVVLLMSDAGAVQAQQLVHLVLGWWHGLTGWVAGLVRR
jgi:uncharacterized membrane-anchored protein